MHSSSQTHSPVRAGEIRALTRGDLVHALTVGVLALALYVTTACPSIYVGDSAEIAGAAAIFGVPHPPGYGLFTPLTGLPMRLPAGLELAHRANLMVALYGAIAVALLALLAVRGETAFASEWCHSLRVGAWKRRRISRFSEAFRCRLGTNGAVLA